MFSIPLFKLNFDEAEVEAAVEALRSGWISMGPRTAMLEEQFAERLGVAYAVATNSGTAALHLALATLVTPGDEVIVPSFTFVATVNAVRYVGAEPVFADVAGPHDLCIDPADVRRKITARTRAVLCMHYGGFACNMHELSAVADEHGLAIAEDAAHAPMVRLDGRSLGAWGSCGCFSFFANKKMTCAEGGMLTTDDADLAARARLLRSHGMTSLSYERASGHATRYDVLELGYNYRLDDVRAALAMVQLDKLDAETTRRTDVRRWYESRLAGLDGLVVPYLGDSRPSSHYIMPVVLDAGGVEARDAVRAVLADRGIQTSVHYPAAHRFAIYRDRAALVPRTDFATDHEITLPMFGSLTEDEVDRVCKVLAEARLAVR